MIEFKCVCGNPFKVTDENAGRTGTCPKCKMPITVPGELPKAANSGNEMPRFPRHQLMAYLYNHQSSNIFILHPHIPEARERAARDYFAIEPGDSVLGVFHPSLLIAGEETMAFTEHGLYLKKADLTQGHVLYESLLEGSIHLEGSRDLVIQAVKPQRLRYRVLVPPGIADYLSKILRGLQVLLNGRDPGPIFAAQDGNNALQDLRAERSGLLPSSSATGGTGPSSGSGGGEKKRRGLLGLRKRE